MSDKRDECGCHKECSQVDHECSNPCWWPSCLTREERAAFDEEVSRWNPETCMTPEEEAMMADYLRTKSE